jgi:hypothetical protein
MQSQDFNPIATHAVDGDLAMKPAISSTDASGISPAQ